MPLDSVSFRAKCGSFLVIFVNFMWWRAKRVVECRVSVLRAKAPVVLVFVACFLLACGDVEANPGPPKKQMTLSVSEAAEPGIGDVMKLLSQLDSKMTNVGGEIKDMKNTMKEQMSMFEELKKENKELKETVANLERKVDDLEGRNRRNNLIFHGVPQPQGPRETWAECEESLKKTLKDELGMEDVEDVEIERAHRLRGGGAGGGQSPRPVIACFRSFKDKEQILAGRRSLKEKRSSLYISEDFSPMVRERRRKLQPFLREAKTAGKKAFLRFDTLVVDGKTHVWDPESQGLAERQAQR